MKYMFDVKYSNFPVIFDIKMTENVLNNYNVLMTC